MYIVFLIQDPSRGKWRDIFLDKAWDRNEEALFLRTAATAATAGAGVSMILHTALIESLNGLDSDF